MVLARYDSPSAARKPHPGVWRLTDAAMIPPAEPNHDSQDPQGSVVLRHGYTLAEVERLTRRALNGPVRPLVDPSDAYEACWGAIVEALLTADEPPEPRWLVGEALRGLAALAQTEYQQHGVVRHSGSSPGGRSSFFERYWQTEAAPTRSPEDAIVDRVSVAQILTRLPEADREALEALATHHTYQAAAAALGCTVQGLYGRVAAARRRALALWHEHEPPSRVWRNDRRDTRNHYRPHDRETCGCLPCGNFRRARSQDPASPLPAVSAERPGRLPVFWQRTRGSSRAQGWPLAELIVARRAQLGLYRPEVARRAHHAARNQGQDCQITERSLRGLEHYHAIPPAESLHWLAVALGLPIEQVEEAAQAQRRKLASDYTTTHFDVAVTAAAGAVSA